LRIVPVGGRKADETAYPKGWYPLCWLTYSLSYKTGTTTRMEYGRAYNYGGTIEHHVIPVVVVCGYAESEAIITKM